MLTVKQLQKILKKLAKKAICTQYIPETPEYGWFWFYNGWELYMKIPALNLQHITQLDRDFIAGYPLLNNQIENYILDKEGDLDTTQFEQVQTLEFKPWPVSWDKLKKWFTPIPTVQFPYIYVKDEIIFTTDGRCAVYHVAENFPDASMDVDLVKILAPVTQKAEYVYHNNRIWTRINDGDIYIKHWATVNKIPNLPDLLNRIKITPLGGLDASETLTRIIEEGKVIKHRYPDSLIVFSQWRNKLYTTHVGLNTDEYEKEKRYYFGISEIIGDALETTQKIEHYCTIDANIFKKWHVHKAPNPVSVSLVTFPWELSDVDRNARGILIELQRLDISMLIMEYTLFHACDNYITNKLNEQVEKAEFKVFPKGGEDIC